MISILQLGRPGEWFVPMPCVLAEQTREGLVDLVAGIKLRRKNDPSKNEV